MRRHGGCGSLHWLAAAAAALAGCGDTNPADPTDACGPNRACPTGYSCDEKRSPTICVQDGSGSVTLALAISGDGSVAASGGGTCAQDSCTYSYSAAAMVTLTAKPNAGARFVQWSGDCSGTTPMISLTLSAARSCTATFAAVDATRYAVTVSAASGGDVAVTPTLTCAAGTCSGSVPAGTRASLQASAAAGHRFTGWTGSAACDGRSDNPLAVDVEADLACTAHFVQRVTVTGAMPAGLDGQVTATAPDASSTCGGSSCVADAGKSVTLVAPTVAGHRLTGFTGAGCDAGTLSGSGLTLVATADLTCTATYALGVSVSGTVVGAVGAVSAASTSPHAQCAAGSCAIDQGGDVTLTAPDLAPASRFLGWSGDAGCAGSALALGLHDVQSSVSCRAGYVARRTVTGLMPDGVAGAIAASSTDTAASCAANACTVDAGARVTLVAPAVGGHRFLGWDGCSGTTASLVVTPTDADVTCRARYATEITVSAVVSGATGTATAASASPGASCSGASCTLDSGGSVTLTAPSLEPAARFVGWQGDAGCTGTARAITLDNLTRTTTCTAEYTPQFTIAATAGSGGSVTATTGGQACPGASCVVDAGKSVTLQATADPGFHFAGWMGAGCDAAANPQTLHDLNATCAASFSADPTFTATGATSPAGVVPIAASAAAGSCAGATCGSLPSGTAVTFSFDAAAVPRGYHFVDWSASCSGPSPAASVTVTVTADLTCTALFRIDVGAIAAPGHASFAVTPASCAGGAAPVCAVGAGTTVTFTVTPDAGWTFASWSGAGCSASGNKATVTAPTQPTTCTAHLLPPSWASAYGDAAGNNVSPFGFVSLGAAGVVLGTTATSANAPARWLLPIAAGDGSLTSPLQITGASLPGNAINQNLAATPGDLVAVGGDLAWLSISSDPGHAPLVVRQSLSAGLRYAVLVPYTPAGASLSADPIVGLAASGANLWVGTSPVLDAAGKTQRRVVLSQLDSTGALLQHLVFGLPFPIETCTGAPPPTIPGQVFDVVLGGLADVGDGLVVAMTDSPADGWILVEKMSYAGAKVWAQVANVGPLAAVNRVVPTAAGGAVVVGTIDEGLGESFYLYFNATGAGGFGGSYGRLLYQDGPSSSLAGAAPLANGGVALAGWTQIMNQPGDGHDAWLVVTDAGGAVVSQRAYGGSGDDSAIGVAPLAGGAYLLGGTTLSFDGDSTNAWAFRTDGSLGVAWNAASGAHQVDTSASVLGLDAKVHTATICPPSPTMLTAPATAQGSLSVAPAAPTVLPLAP